MIRIFVGNIKENFTGHPLEKIKQFKSAITDKNANISTHDPIVMDMINLYVLKGILTPKNAKAFQVGEETIELPIGLYGISFREMKSIREQIWDEMYELQDKVYQNEKTNPQTEN